MAVLAEFFSLFFHEVHPQEGEGKCKILFHVNKAWKQFTLWSLQGDKNKPSDRSVTASQENSPSANENL